MVFIVSVPLFFETESFTAIRCGRGFLPPLALLVLVAEAENSGPFVEAISSSFHFFLPFAAPIFLRQVCLAVTGERKSR